MERIDILIVKKGLLSSRSKAQEAIKNGIIYCNEKKIVKNSYLCNTNDKITIKEYSMFRYVSRGGLKLEKALRSFDLIINNCNILDIGASTGGFTDCALQHGASNVYAIDVGKNLMDEKLRNLKEVFLFESTDIRTFNFSTLPYIDLIVIDVSFISLTKILDYLTCINGSGNIMCLIKPQFECGKTIAKRYQGIIKKPDIHVDVITNITNYANGINLYLSNLTFSPVKGGEGNIEYLAYFKKTQSGNKININNIVADAYDNFNSNTNL